MKITVILIYVDMPILYYCFVNIQQTEPKKEEGATLESERKYRLLAENARYHMDRRHAPQCDLRKPSVYRARGYTPEEIMAMKLTE